jgi:hypothetical protein
LLSRGRLDHRFFAFGNIGSKGNTLSGEGGSRFQPAWGNMKGFPRRRTRAVMLVLTISALCVRGHGGSCSIF